MPDPVPAVLPANPAALGLVGFGLTTVLLSLVNAGVLPEGGEPVVVPLALAYGGLIQIIAGLFEFRVANTFGMTAFLSYGAFWWWFAFLLIFAHTGVIDISKAGPTVGVALLLWGVLTLYLWISTFRMARIIFLIFLTLWPTFLLLALGAITGQHGLTQLGGWLGLVCGALAMFGSFAIVTNAAWGRAVIPMGAPILR
ncbi:acetate uptake transporter [Sphingomonas nostoxanthinifaciens]|uniref:acetate uptake transporter n=1 Tax=Sphingomonas nostoxanthinifaciens TaxID=2872652 RepID=UPI001CC1D357|nr:acetate uptake transporter [Sphingomonas nostoxanthinifaciens]UAK24725.1 acetate uptake transporter [Sphingomonas nostoxanthinifaciens]